MADPHPCVEALILRLMVAEHDSLAHTMEKRAVKYKGSGAVYFNQVASDHRAKARAAEAGAAALENRP